MRGYLLNYSCLMVMLLWLTSTARAQEFTMIGALQTKKNITDYCVLLSNAANARSIEAGPLIELLMETRENRVFNDLSGSGQIPLNDYLSQIMGQAVTIQYGITPEPKAFLTGKKDGRIFFVVEV